MKLHLPITLLASVMSGIGYAEDIAADFSYEVDNPGYVGGGDNLNGFKQDSGATDWSVYYINTSDHEAKASEIIEASKDAQGDARLREIQMYTGTLDVNQTVHLMPPSDINENGEIVARPVINVSGGDTELTGMIDSATMHASGGTISAHLYGDTSLTVTGHVEITGQNQQTGDTIITGPGAKLTIGSATALGASTVKLQNQATLDLKDLEANNMIEVTGCTVANAGGYVGRMEVASDMKFVGSASAGCISLRDKGTIRTAEPLSTTTLEALPNQGADGYNVHTITGDVTIKDSGAIILYSGKQITLTGSLTLKNGVAMVLLDAGGEFAVGDILVTCTSGTITGDFSELDFLINNEEQEGYRVEISEDRKSVVLAEEDKPGYVGGGDNLNGFKQDSGATDWNVYYINTSDHEAKVSEIIEASKDAQGDALLREIQMSAGTLGVNQSVRLMASAATNENGEIVARPVINVSGDDTELYGMINCATMHASGGKIFATLYGDTSLTVTGHVEISGDSSQTGDTIITGPDAKLTIGRDAPATALGDSTVKLQNQATLDLNHKAVDNMIEVTGCTVANADEYVGRMEVASHLTFVGPASAGCISLRDKGAITADSLSTTTLEALPDKGAARSSKHTITGNVTIKNDGAIILYSGKQIILTGSLTLGNGVAMVLLDAGGEFAAGDILVTCNSGTITGDFSELDFLVNNEQQEGYRVEISEDRKSVVLAEEDNPTVDPEEDEEDNPTVAPDVPVQPELAPVFDQATADVLAQGNWGVVTASRAFVGAVLGQRNNMGCIANGRGTAWASLLGGMTDISGSVAAAGSDITLFGAAVGVDMKVGKRSSLGVAFGSTDGEVSADGLADIDQEGGHIALYGEHGLKKFTNNSCLSMDWVAATGTTESKYMGAKWEQDSIQLNTRLTWNKQVTDRFSYNVFGGLDYFASESDRVENCKSGSIQNLRGELGVGVRYVAGKDAQPITDGKCAPAPAPACECVVLYGEVSYINDMVRNNPIIEVNSLRGSGANPGRQGVGVEAGATIRLGEQWSASANYSFNAMDDSNEHVLNIGASRTF